MHVCVSVFVCVRTKIQPFLSVPTLRTRPKLPVHRKKTTPRAKYYTHTHTYAYRYIIITRGFTLSC